MAVEMDEIQPIQEEMDDVQTSATGKHGNDKQTNSSLGPDLSTASIGSSKFDMDDSSELDEIFQQQHLKGGCFGILERLPLFVKLFMMLIIALFGLLLLGTYIVALRAIEVKAARKTKNMAKLSVTTGPLVHHLQRERSYSLIYLFSNGTRFETELREEMVASRSALKTFYDLVNKKVEIDETEQVKFKEMKTLMSHLDSTRSRIWTNSIRPVELFHYYDNCTNALRMFMGDFTDDASNAKLVATLNLIMKFKECSGLTRVLVGLAIESGLDAEFYDIFITSFKNEYLLDEIVRFSGTESVLEEYEETVVPLSPDVYNIVEQVYKDPTVASQLMSFDDWWEMSTARVDAFLAITQFIYDEINSDAANEKKRASASIIAVIIVIVLFFIGSVISAAVFSQAITGPWKRIIKVQESIVKKFLPKHLLRTLKCYRISDITLGKCVEREMTVLFADIRQWTQISEKMNPHQIFSFLNRYYAAIGPVVRNNSGYIDKFRGDQIMACFPNTQSGLKSALEIQEVIAKLNREVTNVHEPEIIVGVGVHTGKVACGIIGEHERMEGTIVSSTIITAARLEALTKVFKAKVITTHEAMKRLRATTEFPYRPLGYVKVKAGIVHRIKIYELIDRSDVKKMETIKEFKSAVTAMIEHNYQHAIDTMQSILSKNPDDVGAKRVLENCVTYLNVQREQRKGLTLNAALANETLRSAFEQFSKDERSEENFQFWLSTEEYKNTLDDIKRVILLKRIFANFLSLDAKFKVNTRDEYTKNVKIAIQDYDERLVYPPAELLNELQSDVEILMGDTFSRFKKNSDQFKLAFKKTLPLPLINILDEDTL
jgi:class 3 adenylate cyclase